MKLLRPIWNASLWGARGVSTVMLWILWLALAGVLALQTYIASTSELAVPEFLLRRIEREIAAQGFSATFDRTSFDPHGRVLVENLRLSLPGYQEPILRARAVYAHLDPWQLVIGRVYPREVRVTGVSLTVPARLTPTGIATEVLSDLDATIVPLARHLAIPQLSGRVGNVTLTARGTVALPALPKTSGATPDLSVIAARFPDFCRRAMTVMGQLEALEAPTLHLELAPHDTAIATADAWLFARSLKLDTPLVAQIDELQIATRGPLLGNDPTPTRLELTADAMSLPFDAKARGVRALLYGGFRPGAGYKFEPTELRVTADRAEAAGFPATAVSAQLTPKPLPQLEADITLRLMGEPLAAHATADFSERSAVVKFAGEVSPHVLDPLGTHLGGVRVQQWFDFEALTAEAGEVRLGPGWKFEKLNARAALRGINAYHVIMEEGHATVELGGGKVYAPEAYARIGTNFAHGSYEQDLKTREFRFLLAGQLRPLDISEWFHGDWWTDFFKQLDFKAAAPAASVEVGGVWLDGPKSRVFVFADAQKPVIRGVAFDRVRTRLFIRPGFYDALELDTTSPHGVLAGPFTYILDPESFAWRSFEMNMRSTLDLDTAAQFLGPEGAQVLTPFKFDRAPSLQLAGRFTSATSPEGEHQRLDIGTHSTGTFRLLDFPLENVDFKAALNDGDIAVNDVTAQFAGGTLKGRARVFGAEPDRHVSFDASLKDASLGAVATALQDYSARTQGRPPSPPGKFVQEKAQVRLDLSAAGEGKYGDLLSYQGDGTAALQGAEIGEVPLLGLLSEVLKFSTLRFTSATAKFKLAGRKIEFPDVQVRGANSSIEARGDFLLDRKAFDFTAKIFPFHESEGLIKSVVGAVLTPISSVFEVKLSGSLEKPEWAITLAPSNFIRALVPGSDAEPGKSPDAAAPSSAAAATPPPPPASPPAPKT